MAYCVDEAIGHFGSTIEQAMDKVKGKNAKTKRAKAENVLRRYLGLKQQFRDASELVKQ